MAKKNPLSLKEFQYKETKYFDALDLLRYNKPKKPSRKQAQQAMKTIKTVGPQINRNAKKLWSTLEKKHKLNIQPIDIPSMAPKKKTSSRLPKKKQTTLYTFFKKSKHGKSKSRKARERLTFTDPYEKQMASRLQKKTGMTYLQIANLVKEAKKSDYIDIETEISSVAGESTQKTELYEAAMRRIKKKTKREKTYTEYSGDELSDLEEMYAMQAEDYYNR